MKKLLILCAAMVAVATMTACKSGNHEVNYEYPGWDAIYSSSDSISIQHLLIRTAGDTLFYEYEIVVDDILNPVHFVGQAILKNGDSEIDEDEKGNAYQVDEYVSDGKEYLAFRFDADSHKRVRIVMDEATAAKSNVTMPTVLSLSKCL